MKRNWHSNSLIFALAALIAMLMLTGAANAADHGYRTIYRFKGGNDGWEPSGIPAVGKNGNLFGVTARGGTNSNGTIFRLSAPQTRGGVWRKTILHNFTGGSRGYPHSIVFGQDGALYGFAWGNDSPTCGFVWKLTPSAFGDGVWAYAVLYTLNGTSDGCVPEGNPVFDAQGNLYGSTELGGDLGCLNGQSCGTVFEVQRPKTERGKWHFNVLYTFTGDPDGAQPRAGVTFDQKGDLYGTTDAGGGYDWGAIYRMSPPKRKGQGWREGILYSFDQSNYDIIRPEGTVAFDSSGNLYGTTLLGGDPNCSGGYGCGVAYKLSRPLQNGVWTYSTLYAFKGGDDGAYPQSALIFDGNENLYGVTTSGYVVSGAVFRLSPPGTGGGPWRETTLHGFTGKNGDGGYPATGLTWGKWGDLYGVTLEGGLCLGCGTVFEVRPE